MDRPELKPGGVTYPETDGKPMAETDRHRELMFDLLAAARYHFRDADDVYTSGNLLVYFVEGDPTRCVSPDFFAVRGVGKEERRVWKVWEEGKAPEVVIELTSTKTHREDLGEKRALYEMLGVQEYFLFDPDGAHFQPQLRGFRLQEGESRPLPVERASDGGLVLQSAVLGLRLWGKGGSLRLVDPISGAKVPTPEDFVRSTEAERCRAERAERRAERAERRAERAERELAELRERLDRLDRPDGPDGPDGPDRLRGDPEG
jgi:Uma2 family endonuclease